MQEKSVHNANIILSRLKLALDLSTDTSLSNFLGIDKSTLSAWKRRNSIDYELIFAKCTHLNYDWILTGSGEMLRKNNPPNETYSEKIDTLEPCPNCSFMNRQLKLTERALEHAETALESAKGEIESKNEIIKLQAGIISNLEAQSGLKRKNA